MALRGGVVLNVRHAGALAAGDAVPLCANTATVSPAITMAAQNALRKVAEQ